MRVQSVVVMTLVTGLAFPCFLVAPSLAASPDSSQFVVALDETGWLDQIIPFNRRHADDRAWVGSMRSRPSVLLLLAEEKKKQVPKKPPTKTKDKDDKESDRSSSDSDSDSGWADCLFNCFLGMFSGSDSEAPETVPESAPPPVSPELEWAIGSLGMILPRDTLARDAPVWDAPGGEQSDRTLLGRMRMGTDVRVTETHTSDSGLWLKVAVDDPNAMSGWVSAADVAFGSATPPELAAVDEAPPEPYRERGRPRAAMLASFSWFKTGPSDIELDYNDGGVTLGVQGLWLANHGLGLGMRLGIARANGSPRFNYMTPTQLDSPTRSRLTIVDIGLRAGQFLNLGGSRFHWGLGPGVYWVTESADIDVFAVQGDTTFAAGTRIESLDRWRLGGDLELGIGWSVGRSTSIGIAARGFAISWKSEERKSLTIDFIGRKTLVGGTIGIQVEHDWF